MTSICGTRWRAVVLLITLALLSRAASWLCVCPADG
jgi:hypothetical protein